MPAVVMRGAATRTSRDTHPKARLVTMLGDVLVIPYAPNDVTHAGFAGSWSQLSRAGRKPLLVRSGGGLRTETFTLTLAYPDPTQSVQFWITGLQKIAEAGHSLTLDLARLERGVTWRMTDLQIRVTMRAPRTNEPTRAEATITLTEDVDVKLNSGPLSGGKKGGKGKRLPTTYVVRKGDRLAKIADRFYGDPDGWRRIAKANDLSDPRKIKVGQKLTIPKEE